MIKSCYCRRRNSQNLILKFCKLYYHLISCVSYSQEIAAEPYVHLEPALSPEALGLVAAAPAAALGYAAAPFAHPNIVAAPVAGVAYAAGLCRNNLGASVPCAL